MWVGLANWLVAASQDTHEIRGLCSLVSETPVAPPRIDQGRSTLRRTSTRSASNPVATWSEIPGSGRLQPTATEGHISLQGQKVLCSAQRSALTVTTFTVLGTMYSICMSKYGPRSSRLPNLCKCVCVCCTTSLWRAVFAESSDACALRHRCRRRPTARCSVLHTISSDTS